MLDYYLDHKKIPRNKYLRWIIIYLYWILISLIIYYTAILNPKKFGWIIAGLCFGFIFLLIYWRILSRKKKRKHLYIL